MAGDSASSGRPRRTSSGCRPAISCPLPVLGFAIPPVSYFAFLVAATLTYLALVEVVKRGVVRLSLS